MNTRRLTAAALLLTVAAGGPADAEQRRRPGAAAAGLNNEGAVLEPVPPGAEPSTGPIPSEFPICPDCQSAGAIALQGTATKVTGISLANAFRTAKDKLGVFLSSCGKARLVVYSNKSRSTVIYQAMLGGFADGVWLTSNGVAFSGSNLSLTALDPKFLDTANWGYDRATGKGYVADIHLFVSGSDGRYVRMPIPIKRPGGTVFPSPP